MKAVMAEVPERILERRRRAGADRWDEMWNGVLHMPPMPTRDHQDLEGALETWLRTFWAPRSGGRVYHQINVARPGAWPDDYRIPDLVLLTPERFGIDRDAYFEGGPDVVVEIRSPGDETDEKLPFYAEVGVREVWIIDRDRRDPEVHACCGAAFEPIGAGADGWHGSPVTGVALRRAESGKLALRLGADPATERELV